MFVQVASHRRSGTHMLIDQLRANFSVLGTFRHLEEVAPADCQASGLVLIKTHEPSPGHKQRRYQKTQHPNIDLINRVSRTAKHLYIFRDPYDTLESLYYFDLAGIEPLYNIDRNTSFMDFLLQRGTQDAAPGENRIQHWFGHVTAWIDHPAVLPIRYETFKTDPERKLLSISAHLGVGRLPKSSKTPPTEVGAGTTRLLKQAELWGPDELAAFDRFADRELLRQLGYPPRAAR